MMWVFCRYEGCRRKLPPDLAENGYCDADCRTLHEEDKAVNLQMAREHIRHQAEENR